MTVSATITLSIAGRYHIAMHMIGCCDTQCGPNNNDVISAANDSNLMWLAYDDRQATLMVNWTTPSSSGKHY